MLNEELLAKVKIALFGSAAGAWRDDTLQVYIDEIKEFMANAGVPADVIESEAAVGVIVTGVNDLWNYSSGGTKLSPYFIQRVIQMSAGSGGASNAATE